MSPTHGRTPHAPTHAPSSPDAATVTTSTASSVA